MFENMLIHIDDMEGGGLGILKGCDIQWPFPTSFQTDFHRFSRWCTWLGVIHVVRLHLCWKHLEWLVRTWVIDLFCFFRIIYEPDHEVLLFKFSCQHVVPVQLANTMAPVRAYWGRGTVFQNLIPSISLVFPFLSLVFSFQSHLLLCIIGGLHGWDLFSTIRTPNKISSLVSFVWEEWLRMLPFDPKSKISSNFLSPLFPSLSHQNQSNY